MKHSAEFQEHIVTPSFFIGKQGNNIISFGSGQPDLAPPQEVYDILPSYRAFAYGVVQGQLRLREMLAEQYQNASADNFVITNGASEALDLILRTLSSGSGNDCVLIPRPYYYSYPYNVKFAHMKPVYTDLREGRMDITDIAEKIKTCKVMLINSPSNPTGRVEDVETLKEIERLAQKYGTYIISDEVYRDLIYERENYTLKGERVITVNSFSKTYSMCGFRVGYLYTSDLALVKKIIDIKTHTSMNTNILAQAMAQEAMGVPQSYITKHVAIWRERRDLIYQGLCSLGFSLWKPEGAFYVFPKIKNANIVINELYYKHKVIAYDGAWFGAPGRVRLSYALSKEKIEEGLERIKSYIKDKNDWLL